MANAPPLSPPALTVGFILLAMALPAYAPPPLITDNFTPQYGALLPDPPPGGWLLWSSPATWPGGQVPGTGANVTIPCNTGVLLDVAFVQLTLLEVQGSLKIKDSPSLPLVNITAAFIVVKGRFIIGNSTNQFKQKVEIRLMPNPNNRADYAFTSPLPAEPAYARNLGHKVFAVVGGQVDFHGLPGSADTLTWTRLTATAPAGASSITVKGNVSDWPVGAPIVVAPTDYFPDQEDVRTIVSVSCTVSNCTIKLNASLAYNHFAANVSDGFGGFIEEAAEVALLRRNIVITGTDEPAPYNYQGGHFIVFLTKTQQILEGVQFLLMGQQGQLGRYNIHFHVCKEQNSSIVRKNLMMHSKQRCVVVHATFNLVVEGNVAYNTSGHCFMIEEGGETGNTFLNNFGLRTRAVDRKIASDETDDVPATFWITNPNNSYIGNAAGGSDDSGFWLELRPKVRGMSASWPQVNSTVPSSVWVAGKFAGNTAHSNLFGGFRMYPHGYQPRFNATVDGDYWDDPVWVELGNFNLWKNQEVGVFIHDSDHIVFSNSTFADNTWAIELLQVQGVNVTGHRIVGLTNNYGNPQYCDQDWGKWSCGPITGCKFPLATGVAGRSVPWGLANESSFGVVFEENRQYEDGTLVNILANTSFAGFDNSCPLKASAAIAISGERSNFWNAGHGFKTVKFSSTTKTNQVYFMPRVYQDGEYERYYGGEPSTFFALRDLDGSYLGSPGYILANNTAILPPSNFTPQCTAKPGTNTYSCPKTCYRTVQVLYYEPGFAPYPAPANYGDWPDSPRVLGDYSYLQVTRVEDGSTLKLAGNLHQYVTGFDNGGGPYNDTARFFPMSLLSGYTYEISFFSGKANPSFLPSEITLQYKDGPGCGAGVVVRLKGSTVQQYSWAVAPTDFATWAPCPGNTQVLSPSVVPVPYTYVCSASLQALQLSLTTSLPAMEPIVIYPTVGAPAACSTSTRCGLTSTFSVWAYNQQNLDLHPQYPGGPAFYNPGYPTPPPVWGAGRGALGYEGWNYGGIQTYLASPDWNNLRTYYFKTSFNLTGSSCYSQLLVDVVVLDGVVLYLNNVELMRSNMPSGVPDNMTQALSHTNNGPQEWYLPYTYTSFSLPLLGAGVNYSLAEGLNHVAAEVHVNVDNGWDIGFSLRLSAIKSTTCTAPKVTAEVCDGVDNNADGKIDIDPATGKLLQRPCWTACGSGVETCINGAYQNCTAKRVLKEVCNNIDDNCDGLVDNGPGQLNCSNGQVCFAGKCQPVQALATSQALWGPRASGWSYLDTGVDLTASPGWKNGTKPGGTWKTGQGSFGIFPDNTSWTFNTTLASNANGNIWTRYFVKNFTLSDLPNATYGYSFNLQRVDGAVVYLNGKELFRSNMPTGTVGFKTLAPNWMACQDPTWDCYALIWYTYGALRSYGLPTVKGNNWIAVELHPADQWQSNSVFDLGASRYIVQPCPTGVATCVRNPPQDTAFVNFQETWRYLDASLPLPPSNWTSPSFNDSSWPQGPTPIGGGPDIWVQTTMKLGSDLGNGRQTYYFRKAVTITDGLCYFNLTMSVFCNDGAVVYINGGEAARINMPLNKNITATTPASDWPTWNTNILFLSTGWLKAGRNVIAVEVHQYTETTTDYDFDFSLSGQREGVACTPLPA